jgi:hypothetical protein
MNAKKRQSASPDHFLSVSASYTGHNGYKTDQN